jgi:lysylphosphatidylglycerol synthetase-like protein (DUF2156 family)
VGNANSLAWTSLVLAVVVATVALLLGLLLWWDRRTREPDLTAHDQKHFYLQDLRRALGIVVLGLLAVGVYVGSRLPTFVAGAASTDHPARARHPNHAFLAVWLGVFAFIVLLLGLAMIDWISTRRYAQRRRREIHRERIEILRDAIRDSHASGNGQVEDSSFGPS